MTRILLDLHGFFLCLIRKNPFKSVLSALSVFLLCHMRNCCEILLKGHNLFIMNKLCLFNKQV